MRSEVDADGNVSFVEQKPPGYPAVGEPISDDIAAFALRHRKVDIAARYLRETRTPSKHFRFILADMLEGARDSTEEYRLEYVRQRSGNPKGSTLAAQARAMARQNHVGRFALASGRHGTKKAQQEFDYSRSYVEKAKRLARRKKNQ